MSSSKPTIARITLQGDGAHGSDGVNGQDGVDGFRRSSNPLNASTWHGTDGSNATIPEPGKDGLDITLTLSTLEDTEADDQTNGQKKKVKVHATSTQQKDGTNDDKLLVLWDEVYGLNHIPTIRWSTTGGNGGNGARGGHGGNGAPGLNGTGSQEPPTFQDLMERLEAMVAKVELVQVGPRLGTGTMTVKVNEKDARICYPFWILVHLKHLCFVGKRRESGKTWTWWSRRTRWKRGKEHHLYHRRRQEEENSYPWWEGWHVRS
jgi:hypothetical protein